MPPALAAAARAAIDVARFEDWRRDRLARLIAHFRAGAAERGLASMDSRTPIQPIVIGSSAAVARSVGAARGGRLLCSRDSSADGAGRQGASAHHVVGAAGRERCRTVTGGARQRVRDETSSTRRRGGALMHIDNEGEGPDLVMLHGWAMHGGHLCAARARAGGAFSFASRRPAGSRRQPQRCRSTGSRRDGASHRRGDAARDLARLVARRSFRIAGGTRPRTRTRTCAASC